MTVPKRMIDLSEMSMSALSFNSDVKMRIGHLQCLTKHANDLTV